jgi:hypothetical protein
VLIWDPVPGAATYNVYRYDDVMATGVKSPTYTISASRFHWGLTYTVTAVGPDGKESIPSALSSAQGAFNPNNLPTWAPPQPRTPFDLTARAEWNAGRPRVVVGWRGGQSSWFYNVYRDGVLVASNVWGLYYIDTKVSPGESHVYSVSAVNADGLKIQESVRSGSVVGTALKEPPAGGGSVKVTGVRSNDDSAIVFYEAVPGARDYRVYDPARPTFVKYSGGNTSVEWNGINPATGVTLVVEALDKMGPYQKMDGDLGPGGMDHATGAPRAEINGQGDPSNVPIVLAKSAPFGVTCRPRTMDGEQVFFDTFRNSSPFVPAPVPSPLWEANRNNVGAVQNDKWLIYNVMGDLLTSRVFAMSGHFMDTLYDGGTPGTNDPLHQNNAALLMQPKQYADISGGRVLHVTFEVDSHFNGRRWCDVIVAGADDTLVNPGKFWETNMMPTLSANIFRWEIHARHHTAQRFLGKNAAGEIIGVPLFDQVSGVGPDSFGLPARLTWDNIPTWNGTSQDLDRRHRFDLYLSRDRFQVWEEGTLIKDKQLPAGTELPFTRAAVYFLHAAYHTDLDRQELIEYTTSNYWIHHRPFADERHWDNMGFSVVNEFPTSLQH